MYNENATVALDPTVATLLILSLPPVLVARSAVIVPTGDAIASEVMLVFEIPQPDEILLAMQ
jgi:hypothetical protein